MSMMRWVASGTGLKIKSISVRAAGVVKCQPYRAVHQHRPDRVGSVTAQGRRARRFLGEPGYDVTDATQIRSHVQPGATDSRPEPARVMDRHGSPIRRVFLPPAILCRPAAAERPTVVCW